MSLADTIRLMQARRAELVAELAQLDADLAGGRLALEPDLQATAAEPPAAAPAVAAPTAHTRTAICERCRKSFEPTKGAAGRFCPDCYAGGLTIEIRRQLILDALAPGPRFVFEIRQGRLAHVSKGTVQNDLTVMRREHRVENGEHGWRLAGTPDVLIPNTPVHEPRARRKYVTTRGREAHSKAPDPDPSSASETDRPRPVEDLRLHDVRPRAARRTADPALPPRRCSLCPQTYRPRDDRDYLCADCRAKKFRPEPEPEIVASWSPSRDDPAASSELHGSSLARETVVRAK